MPIVHLSDLPPACDLVVVGGGVIGAATAFHAGRAGLSTLLIERRPALSTLTTAAAAGGFRLQLDDQEELRLVSESVELFDNFEDATGQREYDPAVRHSGYLWLTTSAEGAERQRRLVAAQRSWGVDDVHLLTGDEIRAAFPYVSKDVVQARFRKGDGFLDPRRLALGMIWSSGASVVTSCEVVGFRVEGNRLRAVETTGGTVWTDAAVIAAGPFSGRVVGLSRVDLSVTTVRRHKVVVPDVPVVPDDAPMTIDEDTGAHWRPALSGAFLLFADPATAPSPPEDSTAIDQRFAFRLLDPDSLVSVARVTPFWRDVWTWGGASWMLQAGHYTLTPDRRPLIGPTGIEGLFVNTGYNGRGIMEGPAGSRLLVDVLIGKAGPDENPFRPDRVFEAHAPLDRL